MGETGEGSGGNGGGNWECGTPLSTPSYLLIPLKDFHLFSLKCFSVRRCAELMTQLPRIKPRVSLQGHGILQRGISCPSDCCLVETALNYLSACIVC